MSFSLFQTEKGAAWSVFGLAVMVAVPTKKKTFYERWCRFFSLHNGTNRFAKNMVIELFSLTSTRLHAQLSSIWVGRWWPVCLVALRFGPISLGPQLTERESERFGAFCCDLIWLGGFSWEICLIEKGIILGPENLYSPLEMERFLRGSRNGFKIIWNGNNARKV